MCERCVRSQKAMEEYADRIAELIDQAKMSVDGNYPDDTIEMIGNEPFPADKPFLEKMFQLATAGMRLATAQAIIEGCAPSEILMEWAQVAMEGEAVKGISSGPQIRAMAIPVRNPEDLMRALGAILGGLPEGPDEDDEPTIFH